MEKWLIQYLSQISPAMFCVVAAAIFICVVPGILKYAKIILAPFQKWRLYMNEREAREEQIEKNTEDIESLKQELAAIKRTHTHDIDEVEKKATERKHQSETIVATWKHELDNIIEMLSMIRQEATDREMKQMQREIKDMRYKIIRFSKELRCNDPKSKDEFNHIFETIADYHKVLDELEMENGQIDIEVQYINSKYMLLLETNGFVE